MHLLDLSPRDGLYYYSRRQDSTSLEKKSCKSSASWRIWCPLDIVLWAIIVILVLLLVFLKTYRSRKDRDLESPSQLKRYNSPRPKNIRRNTRSDLLPPSVQADDDPYLVVNHLDDSLIAKDPAFAPTVPPEPAQDKQPRRTTGTITTQQLTGLGITFGSQTLPTDPLGDLSITMLSSQTLVMRNREDRVDVSTMSDVTSLPPPVFIRNARSIDS